MDDLIMAGKRVLLTGGTDGIGKEAARQLARMGADLVIVGRDPQKTASLNCKGDSGGSQGR